MKRSVCIALSAFAAIAVSATGTGCSAELRDGAKDGAADEVTERVDEAVEGTYQVTYEVTGEGIELIEFNGGRGTATRPRLESAARPDSPWTRTVTLRGIAAPTVLAVPGSSGAIATCRITYRGEVIKEETAEGRTAPVSCVAISPLFD